MSLQLVVPVPHPEPGQQRGVHLCARGVRRDHDGIVGQLSEWTRNEPGLCVELFNET